jgi:hypothetical protein
MVRFAVLWDKIRECVAANIVPKSLVDAFSSTPLVERRAPGIANSYSARSGWSVLRCRMFSAFTGSFLCLAGHCLRAFEPWLNF